MAEVQDEVSEMSAGFDAEAPEAPAKEPVQPEAREEPKPKPEPAPAAPAAEGPKYVQLTEEQYARLNAAADETAGLKQQMSKAFGTMGNLQQVIGRLQTATPAGASVEISAEDFAELAEDFPELAGHTRRGLEKIFKRLNVRGTGSASVDTEQVASAVRSARQQDAFDVLDDLHPGWRDIVGRAEDADNAFRKWLAMQSQDYQDRINTTQSASITARAIDQFKAATQVPASKPAAQPQPQPSAPKIAARKDRFQAAVQPRGAGGPPSPSSNSADDEFQAGFATG
ncbi:MAG: hypothetical protein BGN99_06560 [Alphaproteobacteria bacterium 65-37]|nr:hypothetical protein [Alphaproteobacteria bacterium]OJU31088.1 MAG: hypothetical protein BGN99_06560 [Alphaproteobacteria bacterium 65-37]